MLRNYERFSSSYLRRQTWCGWFELAVYNNIPPQALKAATNNPELLKPSMLYKTINLNLRIYGEFQRLGSRTTGNLAAHNRLLATGFSCPPTKRIGKESTRLRSVHLRCCWQGSYWPQTWHRPCILSGRGAVGEGSSLFCCCSSAYIFYCNCLNCIHTHRDNSRRLQLLIGKPKIFLSTRENEMSQAAWKISVRDSECRVFSSPQKKLSSHKKHFSYKLNW